MVRNVEDMGYNENITFRVGTDYLLQIHEPVEEFQTQFIYEGEDRMAVYETELKFLAYLKKQGMIVYRNSRGIPPSGPSFKS